MSDMAKNEYRNILILKPSAAGDIISALPVLPALKRRFPNARVTWLVASHLADLLRGHPLIDELIEFDRKRYGYLLFSWTVTRRFLKFLRRLRDARYDLVLDLQGLFRTGFFAWVTRAGVRIGPAEKRECGWIFYSHRIPPRPRDTHIVDRIGAVGELLGLDLADPEFIVHWPKAAEDRVHEMLRAVGLVPGRFIALAPGGTWPSKRWPPDKFARLAELILTELNLAVALIGGRAEQPLARAILHQVTNPRLVDLTGRTGLAELPVLLSAARALVTNDSGPMHLAVALGKPVTAVIGPTNPNRTGPYRRPHGVVKTTLACSPCFKRKCPKVGADAIPLCMDEISPEQVFENLQEQLPGDLSLQSKI